ncbi:hypothetical protein NsoK4_04775 [Nitrosopumilus sp. K4]|uniref:hypothetical protein n=1 Tax=Nitrosopumilus sp. K4 TaxID=2795383 RepID=UPI001BA76B22|nr:hypothetical protein [Nitrosopumilus sp. K4]QUC65553.1 hypothetical protein NsoK4_04775 [Nitrosopumilus sp. K4]
MSILEKTILEFVKNRGQQNETTTSRHIHRRFDIPIEKAEEILTKLSEKNIIKKIFDEEYQEYRFMLKE